MSLKGTKNKIRSIGKTHKVTKAMEAVSAVKMRKSQARALSVRSYALSALRILERIQGSVDMKKHVFARVRDNDMRIAMLLVTSDKGLAGSLNAAVIKGAHALIDRLNLLKKDVTFFCIGEKGREYFRRRGYTIAQHYTNIGDDVPVNAMRDVTDEITRLFREKTFGHVFVAYTNFISTFEQRAIVRKVLPIDFEELREMIEGILPKKGKFAEPQAAVHNRAPSVYTIEPSPEEVFEELLPFLLNIELFHALLESKASEHSARMVAMKNASDKAEEMKEELTRLFNKERQSQITREVSEIVGGMEATLYE